MGQAHGHGRCRLRRLGQLPDAHNAFDSTFHIRRGHTGKTSSREELTRPELPPARPGDEMEWSRDESPARRTPQALPQPPTTGPRTVRKRADRPAQHPLVGMSREYVRAGRVTEVFFSGAPHVRPAKRKLVDVVVSQEALPRALESASELYLEMPQIRILYRAPRNYAAAFTTKKLAHEVGQPSRVRVASGVGLSLGPGGSGRTASTFRLLRRADGESPGQGA